MPLVLKGVVGQVKWSYYVAAAINGYTISRTGDEWKLTATVVSSDAFKLSRKPLLFVALHEKGDWRWPIVGYELNRGTLTAQLDAPLETNQGGSYGLAGRTA